MKTYVVTENYDNEIIIATSDLEQVFAALELTQVKVGDKTVFLYDEEDVERTYSIWEDGRELWQVDTFKEFMENIDEH